jgi:glycosyltransferase involved in cell wall biosynthesis
VVKRLAFAFPGDLATPTGGYAYCRRMIAELRGLGWQIDPIGLGEGFPKPSGVAKSGARDKLAAVPQGCPILIDGLAFGVLPEAANELRERNPLIALVHHPLALETGVSDTDAVTLHKSESDALATARAVIAVSPSTANILTEQYDVPSELVSVANPGTDRPSTMAPGSRDGIVRLVSVGAVVPRKGFDVLIEALAALPELPWRLSIAGDRSRDEKAVAELDESILRHRLADRVKLLGALSPEQLETAYLQADLFVLASRFEGYGMAYAEAIAHGLPVVGTTAGAIPDTVPPNAGVLVEPNDVKALVRTLRMLIENPKERQWLAEGARTAAAELPTWQDSARIIAGVIEALA